MSLAHPRVFSATGYSPLRRWSARLCGSTACTSLTSLVMLAGIGGAAAQTAVSNPSLPYTVEQIGTDQPDASGNGAWGATGGAPASDVNIQINAGPSGSGAATFVTRGGKGGNGASSSESNGDGGQGGDGATAPDIALGFTAGSNGSLFFMTNSGPVWTVSSQGGKGGNGGDAGETGKGGASGKGGDGGNILLSVDVPTQRSLLSISSTAAAVVQLSSIGGNSGDVGSGTDAHGSAITARDAASAGNGGNITAQLSGNIAGGVTEADVIPTVQGSGIVATSLGGNGGAGGQAITSICCNATGGNGGAGGNGNTVSLSFSEGWINILGAPKPYTGNALQLDQVTVNGTVVKDGSGNVQSVEVASSTVTAGLLAQSVGGTGGAGGTANVNGVGTPYGGWGGPSGTGGPVSISMQTSSVSTFGYAALGVMALSVGGSGGDGASASGLFTSHGGNGAAGGDADSASVTLGSERDPAYRMITTTGSDSDAVVAMSIGGGGGYGADVQGGSLLFSSNLGGQGANGGDGGRASASNGYLIPNDDGGLNPVSGYVISTVGDYARGLVAASIGGGGGRGGDATSIGVAGLAMSIGGKGGNGGDGNSVQVINTGIIQTTGQHSVGIDAGSIGGGGGAGGAATSIDAGSLLTVAVSVGGQGGTGGDAGDVEVSNFHQIVTMGADAYGIRAQSIGGGGGAGGATLAATFAAGGSDQYPTITATVGIGGAGGTGGVGSTVSLENMGFIATQGTGAGGILAQSVGGGGGTGGDSQGLSESLAASSITANVAIGGKGGHGGDADAVAVANGGLVWTLGAQAPGILAQSVGGGGGAGGLGEINAGGHKGGVLTVDVTVGGAGGTGGDGNNVTVVNYLSPSYDSAYPAGYYGTGSILTLSDQSDGIFAQSVGGGGGAGGNSTSGGSGGQITVNVAVGGDGGNGGAGGNVTVANGGGAILTAGAGSAGIFAQSVGGGGGRGGSAATGSGTDPLVSVATFMGKDLLSALNVNTGSGQDPAQNPSTLTQVGTTIWDLKSPALGFAGLGYRLAEIYRGYELAEQGLEVPDDYPPSLKDITVDIGAGRAGGGGAGGNGGAVYVSNDATGSIVTFGPLSPAILAQSVGGGGGVGGGASPAVSGNTGGALVQGAIGIGGGGGSSGDGGPITIDNAGALSTAGDLSPAIFAQSIGGGGGLGGLSANGNEAVIAPIVITLGGQSGASGSGGTVVVASTGTLSTTGDESYGIAAQSVGGGGGTAAVFGGEYDAQTGGATSTFAAAAAFATAPTIEGNVSWSPGNTVQVDLGDADWTAASIQTSGRNAYGILAQSVGGGGGLILGVNSVISPSSLFSGGTGDGDNGGNVSVTVHPNAGITTSGAGAVGVLAQSIGGGGGIIGGMDGVAFNVLATSPSDRKGYSGVVNVTSYGNITTTGAYAHGIFAQSAGSGGGIIGGQSGGAVFAGGSTTSCGSCTDYGSVQVNVQGGAVSVSGAHAYGVAMVASGTSQGLNTAVLNVSNATITASGNADAAVFLGGLTNNVFVNGGGVIDGSATTSGTAIASWNASPAMGIVIADNGGTVRGSVSLANGSIINVGNTGKLEMGSVMNVGVDGIITNHGTLGTSAVGKIGKTTITGSLVQGPTGHLVADTNHATGAADLINVQGTAALAGTIDVNSTNLSKQAVTILTASGGVTLDPALAVTQTYLFNFAPRTDGASVQIQPQAEFRNVPGGLTATEQQVASHLQEIWDSGSPLGGGFDSFGTISDGATYRQALDSLSGQSLGAIAAFRFTSSQNFVNNLHSCPVFGPSGATLTQDDCTWARLYGNQTTQGTTGDTLGYTASAQTMQFGAQKEIATDWFLGLSAGYESSDFDGDGGLMQVTGQAFLAGAVLKYQDGPWLVAGSINAGYGWYDSARAISIGATTLSAEASPVSWHAGLGGRISYQMPFQHWYATPTLELGAFYVGSDGYTETGAGPFNLTVEPGSSFAYTAAASLEVGTLLSLGQGASLRPFASIGVGVIGSDGWSATAHFAGFETATSGFTASSPIPDLVAKVSAGADLVSSSNIALQLQYNGILSDQYASHTGLARLNYRF